MIDTSSVRRLAENEAVFRQRNETVRRSLAALDKLAKQEGDVAPRTDDLVLRFYCECSDEDCRVRVPINFDEYANIHQDRRHFIVVPGHEVTSIEQVIKKARKYYVVEKFVPIPQSNKLNKTDAKDLKVASD